MPAPRGCGAFEAVEEGAGLIDVEHAAAGRDLRDISCWGVLQLAPLKLKVMMSCGAATGLLPCVVADDLVLHGLVSDDVAGEAGGG